MTASTAGGVGNGAAPEEAVDRQSWSEGGSSLIEIVVTMGMIAVLLGTAIIGLRGNFMDFRASTRQLLNDLRLARASAVTRGAHYRVTFIAEGYQTERLQDDDGDGSWEPGDDENNPPIVTALPAGVTVSVTGNQGGGSGSESGIEFDTRGMLVAADDGALAEPMTIVLQDTQGAQQVTIQVWPSGQMGFVRAGQSTGGGS